MHNFPLGQEPLRQYNASSVHDAITPLIVHAFTYTSTLQGNHKPIEIRNNTSII